MVEDRWERLRRRLIAHADLFEDSAAYTAGVEDAITAVRAMLAPSAVTPRPHLHVVEPPADGAAAPPRARPVAPGGLSTGS